MKRIILSPEENLLFLSCRTQINEVIYQRIKTILNNYPDWGQIIKIATRHQVLPFIYHTINKLSLLNNIPKEILEILRNYYYVNLNRNFKLWKELSLILESLNQIKIKIVLLKGIILMETIYRNLALRIIGDIDVLTKEDDLSIIRNLLLELGYKETYKSPEYYKRPHHSLTFSKQISENLSLYLELHWKIAPSRPYNVNLPIWGRMQGKTINGQKVFFLSAEDTLILLAIHLRRHIREPCLKFICDISELLNNYARDIDYKYLKKMALNNHLINTIYFSLYISDELLGASVPFKVLNEFSPGTIKRKLINFCMNKYNFLKQKGWQGTLVRLLIFDRTIDILVYLWRASFWERFIAAKILRKFEKI